MSEQLRFGVGSALAMVLLVVTLGLLWVASRFVRIGEALGGDDE